MSTPRPVRTWPAVAVRGTFDADIVLAVADDAGPTAVDENDGTLRIFFAAPAARADALSALRTAGYDALAVDVADEDWARRSQANLGAVAVGRITIAPPWEHAPPSRPDQVTIVIQPSMGFGTGHHATTRLCLEALQAVNIAGRTVLDLGTGSGVLALAAAALGAASAHGIDDDADAVRSAQENLALNPGITAATVAVADLFTARLPSADVLTANLTGAFLVRGAERLATLMAPGGTLIISGLLQAERDDVTRAFAAVALHVRREREEDGWLALALTRE
ncbi:MAG: 50S ribosomal protein L11 methyltransferase [Acidobacteriota bacterium]